MIVSNEELARRAGVDPWTLLEDVASGNPAEITAMAAAFARAGGSAELATELGREGSQLAADGYVVDGASVVEADAEARRTAQQLGTGSGNDLREIARLLDRVSDSLEDAARTARREVDGLEGEIRRIERARSAFYREHRQAMAPEDREAVDAGYVEDAVQAVRDYGGRVRAAVENYDEGLAGHLRTLADLGYVPPDDVVDLDAPTAADAARDTVGATRDPDPEAARRRFEQATSYLELLNGKRAAGVELSDTEVAWLRDYYEGLAPHLEEVADWVDRGVCEPDRGDPTPNRDDPYARLGGRVADGLLNLSHQVPYAQLPQPVRDIVDGNIGTTEPRGIGDGERMPVGYPHGADPALTRYAGLVDFLDDYAGPDAEPSAELARHLGDAAIGGSSSPTSCTPTTRRTSTRPTPTRRARQTGTTCRSRRSRSGSGCTPVSCRRTRSASSPATSSTPTTGCARSRRTGARCSASTGPMGAAPQRCCWPGRCPAARWTSGRRRRRRWRWCRTCRPTTPLWPVRRTRRSPPRSA